MSEDRLTTKESAPVAVTAGDRYLADRFKWAAPGDRQHDVWLARFDDNDLREMVFEGPDAEAEAWAAWERHAPGYNMRVFRLAALAQPRAAIGDGDVVAAALCNDKSSRLIARQLEAPCYEDSAPHVQEYWRALAARAALALQSPPAAKVDGEAIDLIRDMVRLAGLGFEDSLREPEASGNYAVYERAKRFLALQPAAQGGAAGETR